MDVIMTVYVDVLELKTQGLIQFQILNLQLSIF